MRNQKLSSQSVYSRHCLPFQAFLVQGWIHSLSYIFFFVVEFPVQFISLSRSDSERLIKYEKFSNISGLKKKLLLKVSSIHLEYILCRLFFNISDAIFRLSPLFFYLTHRVFISPTCKSSELCNVSVKVSCNLCQHYVCVCLCVRTLACVYVAVFSMLVVLSPLLSTA